MGLRGRLASGGGKRAKEVVGQLFAAHRPLAASAGTHHPWLMHELLAERRRCVIRTPPGAL